MPRGRTTRLTNRVTSEGSSPGEIAAQGRFIRPRCDSCGDEGVLDSRLRPVQRSRYAGDVRRLLELGIAISAALTVSCSLPPPEPAFATGDDFAITKDGLRRVERSGFQLAWLHPGASLADYDNFELIYAGATYRRPPRHRANARHGGQGGYALPEQVAEEFSGSLRRSFHDALTRAGLRATESAVGARGLVVQVALADLVINAPLRRSGDENVAWIHSIGAITVKVDLFDARSRERLGHFAERNEITSESTRPIRPDAGDAVYEMNRISRKWARQLEQLFEVLRSHDLTS